MASDYGNATRLDPPTASSNTQLIYEAVACGSGVPAHTPRRAAQTYTDTATGNEWKWWNGSWKGT